MIRSAVEREFITIGEALKVLAVREPQLFAAIPEGRQIIDFRNLLTHEYLNVSKRVLSGVLSKSTCLCLLSTADNYLSSFRMATPDAMTSWGVWSG